MSARQPFGLDTGATPDFESEAAEVTAEAVAFASAAAMAAHEIGLRRQAFMRLIATVADGVWAKEGGAADARQPAKGDIMVFPDGVIAVDDVRDGEVYFRSFPNGYPAFVRMTLADFAASNAEAKLIGYVEEIEPGRGAAELAAAKVTL